MKGPKRVVDHLEHAHSILLAGSVDRVFPLFTPKGETLWVDGWNPDFLHPSSGETCAGMVFRTAAGNEVTLWACVDWDPAAYRVRYARVTPGSRFGFVEVVRRDCSDGSTLASVAYAFTALSDEGRSCLAVLSEGAFARMIDDWQIRIDDWLLRNPPA